VVFWSYSAVSASFAFPIFNAENQARPSAATNEIEQELTEETEKETNAGTSVFSVCSCSNRFIYFHGLPSHPWKFFRLLTNTNEKEGRKPGIENGRSITLTARPNDDLFSAPDFLPSVALIRIET
jgi:hypothetical protein